MRPYFRHGMHSEITRRSGAIRSGQVNKVTDKACETKAAVQPGINQAVKGCPDNNQRRRTSCQCVVSNYLTNSDSWTLRGKVDESSTSAATPLPRAFGLSV